MVDVVLVVPSAVPMMVVIVIPVMVVPLGIHDIHFSIAMLMLHTAGPEAERSQGYSPR
jgi:hypothetical protein